MKVAGGALSEDVRRMVFQEFRIDELSLPLSLGGVPGWTGTQVVRSSVPGLRHEMVQAYEARSVSGESGSVAPGLRILPPGECGLESPSELIIPSAGLLL